MRPKSYFSKRDDEFPFFLNVDDFAYNDMPTLDFWKDVGIKILKCNYVILNQARRNFIAKKLEIWFIDIIQSLNCLFWEAFVVLKFKSKLILHTLWAYFITHLVEIFLAIAFVITFQLSYITN